MSAGLGEPAAAVPGIYAYPIHKDNDPFVSFDTGFPLVGSVLLEISCQTFSLSLSTLSMALSI
jgi:hypothetical protein